MAFATPSTVIWPTGIGDFLVKRVSTGETQGDRDGTVERNLGTGGYLVSAPGRPLLWDQASPIATTSEVLVFRDERPLESDLDVFSPQAGEGSAESKPLDTVSAVNAYETAVEEAGAEQGPAMSESVASNGRRGSILDEKFVNWVTRRIDETKVEIPFNLPTEGSIVEPVAPTDRVRVRYRVEP
jgi:hypothetical protein